MAVQIWNRQPGYGSQLAQNLTNTALGGLDRLTEHKINQLQQRTQRQGIEKSLEPFFSKPVAQALSIMSPKEREVAVEQLGLQVRPEFQQQQAIQQQQGVQQQPAIQQQLQGQQQGVQQQPAIQQQAMQQQQAQQMNPAAILKARPVGKVQGEIYKNAQQEQNNIDKETLPVYKETIKAAKGAHDTTKTLDRMEQLISGGKLSDPRFNSLLKTLSHGIWGFGIDLHSLESPESAEFTKLSNSFIKNAKNIFGSRITDNDLKAFMNTVPTLSQNDEGKRRIIHNMRLENKGAEIRRAAMDQIIKENHGRRPMDLESQIEDRAGEQLDAIAQEFTKGYQAAPTTPQQQKQNGASALAYGPSFLFPQGV